MSHWSDEILQLMKERSGLNVYFGLQPNMARPFLFFDKGYMRRKEYIRVAYNSLHTLPTKRLMPNDRFSRLSLELKHRPKNGSDILCAASSDKYNNYMGLTSPGYYPRMIQSKRKVILRPKTDVRTPIYWDDIYVLCTHGSNVAVEALLQDVPIIVSRYSVCYRLSTDQVFMEAPHRPTSEDREQFFNALAYCQWTLDEFKSGEAWEHIKKEIQ